MADKMKRRDLFKVTAAAAAAPGVALGQQPATATAAPATAAAAWKPALLDAHENNTVIALCSLIIPATDTPGAKEANVHRYIDLFLKDGDAERRQAFFDGLHWTDAQSMKKHGKPFVRCTPDQQTAMLTEMSATPGPGQDFFRLAKAMIVDIYYKTPAGFRELNKGVRVPQSFGCTHSGKHPG